MVTRGTSSSPCGSPRVIITAILFRVEPCSARFLRVSGNLSSHLVNDLLTDLDRNTSFMQLKSSLRICCLGKMALMFRIRNQSWPCRRERHPLKLYVLLALLFSLELDLCETSLSSTCALWWAWIGLNYSQWLLFRCSDGVQALGFHRAMWLSSLPLWLFDYENVVIYARRV